MDAGPFWLGHTTSSRACSGRSVPRCPTLKDRGAGELPHTRVSNAIRLSPDAFAPYLKAAGYRGRPTSTDSAAPAERASLRFPTRTTPGSRRQGTIFAMLFAVFSVNHMFPSGPRVML